MKKIKKEKGITLVALIITIVVLLILAAVAIGTVKDSDIIGYAKNAAEGYNQSKNNELDELVKYESEIAKYAPGEKVEYIGNLRLNRKYIMSGISEDVGYIIFYKDGSADFSNPEGITKVEYTLNDNLVSVLGFELQVVKEENNDILTMVKEGTTPMLLATSINGLMYFSGEKYVNNEAYYTSVTIYKDRYTQETQAGSSYGTTRWTCTCFL